MKRIMLITIVMILGAILGCIIVINRIEITNITKDTVEITIFGQSFEYGYIGSRSALIK